MSEIDMMIVCFVWSIWWTGFIMAVVVTFYISSLQNYSGAAVAGVMSSGRHISELFQTSLSVRHRFRPHLFQTLAGVELSAHYTFVH